MRRPSVLNCGRWLVETPQKVVLVGILEHELGVFSVRWVRVVCGAVFSCFLGTGGIAGCPQGQEPFASCEITGRNTEVFVCFDESQATYRYGAVGQTPDLELSVPIRDVDFRPWSGVGKSIVESVVFYNQGHSYAVYAGFDRPFSEEEMQRKDRHFGGLEVARDGEVLASFECEPETVSYGFGEGIYDVKTASGMQWDEVSNSWMEADRVVDRPKLLREEVQNGMVEECLPQAEFALGGVAMGDPLSKLGKLGSPEPVEIGAEAGLEVDRISVRGLQIDVSQDKVIGLEALSSNWNTPSGLEVGLARGDVIKILGGVPGAEMASAARFGVLGCVGDTGDHSRWFLGMTFGPDGRLQAIGMTDLAP